MQQMIAEQMCAVAEHQTDQCDDAHAAHECLVDAVIILCTEILAGEADGGLIERVHRNVHKPSMLAAAVLPATVTAPKLLTED